MTASPESRYPILIGLALAATMAATRGQQLAPLGHHLPDATLAVFFLAGFYLRPAWVLPALFGVAAAIDIIAVGWGGVSSYCLTPAYGFLLPAYGAVWAAGRWYAGRHEDAARTLPVLAGALLAGGLAAELLASGGFYLFSGRFETLSLAELLGRLATYLPQTLFDLVAYVGAAGIIHLVSKRALAGGGAGGAPAR